MMNGVCVEYIEYKGPTSPRKTPNGTARVLEKGFDTDEMSRYVILSVDSPIERFHGEHKVYYGIDDVCGGTVLPHPMGDDEERLEIARIASYYRAVLVD